MKYSFRFPREVEDLEIKFLLDATDSLKQSSSGSHYSPSELEVYRQSKHASTMNVTGRGKIDNFSLLILISDIHRAINNRPLTYRESAKR